MARTEPASTVIAEQGAPGSSVARLSSLASGSSLSRSMIDDETLERRRRSLPETVVGDRTIAQLLAEFLCLEQQGL